MSTRISNDAVIDGREGSIKRRYSPALPRSDHGAHDHGLTHQARCKYHDRVIERQYIAAGKETAPPPPRQQLGLATRVTHCLYCNPAARREVCHRADILRRVTSWASVSARRRSWAGGLSGG